MVTPLTFRSNSRRRQKCHCTLNCTRSLSIWPPRGLFGRLRPFFLGGLLQAVEIGFHPDGSQLQVARGDDVVTAVDGLRGVTADPPSRHCAGYRPAPYCGLRYGEGHGSASPPDQHPCSRAPSPSGGCRGAGPSSGRLRGSPRNPGREPLFGTSTTPPCHSRSEACGPSCLWSAIS